MELLLSSTQATTVALGGYTSGSGVLDVVSTAAISTVESFSVSIRNSLTDAFIVTLHVTGVNSSTQFAVTPETTDANAAAGDNVYAVLSPRGLAAYVFENASLYTYPPTSGWTFPSTSAIAQQGVTITPVNSALQWMQPSNTGAFYSGYVRSQPSPPYKILISMDLEIVYGNFCQYGVGFWDGTRLKVISLAYASGLFIRIQEYDGSTGSSTDVGSTPPIHKAWFQIENDGTTLTWKFGASPGLLRTFATQSVGTYMTPTHIILLGNKNNSFGSDYVAFSTYTLVS